MTPATLRRIATGTLVVSSLTLAGSVVVSIVSGEFATAPVFSAVSTMSGSLWLLLRYGG